MRTYTDNAYMWYIVASALSPLPLLYDLLKKCLYIERKACIGHVERLCVSRLPSALYRPFPLLKLFFD